MALSTVDTNQIANGKVKNEDKLLTLRPIRFGLTRNRHGLDHSDYAELRRVWPDYRVRDDYD